MKVLILGATGHVGRLLVEQALALDHEVVAFVRDPAKLGPPRPHLSFFKGNVQDAPAVGAAMARMDAVVSAIGHRTIKKSDAQTAATRAVLAHLQSHQRFISLTGSGVSDPRDPRPGLGARLVTLGIKLVPGELYLDGLRHARLLRASPQNWVIVRSPPMTDGPATHHYRTGYLRLKLGSHATRADVAEFMLANLVTDQWLRQAPLIVSP